MLVCMTQQQLLIVIGCCFLSALLSVGGYALWQSTLLPAAVQIPEDSTQHEVPATTFIHAATKAKPAVVYIKTYASKRAQRAGILLSSGSGVLVAAGGYLATNFHVVKHAQLVEVILQDGREAMATIIGVDEATDLALLRLPLTELPYLTFGDSDSLQVGEWVLAIGNPFNLANTVTLGIVSAKGRAIDVLEGEDRIESFIQTDASVNPGNSGGALVNAAGELVGINTAIMTNSGKHEGFAFAIPGNLVKHIISDLTTYGRVERAVMGVYVEAISSTKAQTAGLAKKGLIVKRLKVGGAAEKAGLQSGDLLLEINGQPVNSPAEMQLAISLFRPGEWVSVSFIRNQALRTISLQLGGKPVAPAIKDKALQAAANAGTQD